MLIFVNQAGSPLPTTVEVDPLSDGLFVAATNHNGVPTACNWSLTNASKWGNSFWGTLLGFVSNTYVSAVTLNDMLNVTYLPPPLGYLYQGTINAILTATEISTGQQRNIQIRVDHNSTSTFSSN